MMRNRCDRLRTAYPKSATTMGWVIFNRSRLLGVALIACTTIFCGCSQQSQSEQAPQSVNPGFNDRFANPELDVSAFADRWEAESREVYRNRDTIIELVGLKPGQSVGDIGAGTGLFVEPIARRVGLYGTVYAVEIAPRFIAHIKSRAKRASLPQVKTVLCDQKSVNLAPHSIDVAFCCNTYHHFEYPLASVRSIHEALRAGGRFFVVDFERKEDESPDWILEHVRCGKDQVIDEITRYGFRLIEEIDVESMTKNYILVFEKI